MNLNEAALSEASGLARRKLAEMRLDCLEKGKDWWFEKREVHLSSEAADGLLTALGVDEGEIPFILEKAARDPGSGEGPDTGMLQATVISTTVPNERLIRVRTKNGVTFARVPEKYRAEKRRRFKIGASLLLRTTRDRLYPAVAL